MSGKQYFCDCCRKMGMDSAALFKIGEQNAQCYGGYVYHCPTRLRGPSHRFVVNYIEEQGLYVAWFPLGSAALLSLVSRSADCSQHICRA